MRKLFLVDGAAGFVKNDLVSYVDSKENTTIVTKITTREKRSYECELVPNERNVDLRYVSLQASFHAFIIGIGCGKRHLIAATDLE